MTDSVDPRLAFIEAAVWHGGVDQAEALRQAHPLVVGGDIHTAAILGDDATVRRLLAANPSDAAAKSGPYGGDALNYLCLSKYLRLDKSRSDAFLRAATALLDAGADPNTGFWSTGAYPDFETALYGAAGVARHPGLTQLLLERGADPNDGETVYHAPETYDNAALKLLVESGKLTADSLATILLRKADYHDFDALKWLLDRGVDPNHAGRWGRTALHQALLRDNCLAVIELFLDHGADPTITWEGVSGVQLAARAGRGDVLGLFESRGISIELAGVDGLLGACARNDVATIRSIVQSDPTVIAQVSAQAGRLLCQFARIGNTEGLRNLLDLGLDVAALFPEGDGYFQIAKDSTALHAAAWLARHETVRFLIARGAPVNQKDGDGRTPLALAVKACVDSYWTSRRSPESVEALLNGGATVDGVCYPSGYAEVDDLLRPHGCTS